MNEDIRIGFIAALTGIAPEVDGEDIDPEADLLDDYDLDSMDLLNLVTALSERFGVDIPEKDYPELRTLERAEAYLSDRASGAAA